MATDYTQIEKFMAYSAKIQEGNDARHYRSGQPAWGQAVGKKGAAALAFIFAAWRVAMQKTDHWKDQIS
jgi:hypothetical protein